MSVQPMKFITITGPVEAFDQVVRSCVINRQFHLEPAVQSARHNKWLRPMDTANPMTPLLRQADELICRLGLEPAYRPFPEQADTEETKTYLDGLDSQLDQMEKQMDQLRQEAVDDRSAANQLEKLAGLSLELSELRKMQHLVFRFGHMPQESYRSFQEALEKREDCFFFPTKTDGDQLYGCYFALRSKEETVDALFASMHFVPVDFSDQVNGTAQQAIVTLTNQARDDETRVRLLQGQEQDLAAKEGERLLSLRSWLCRENQVMDVRRYAARSKETFYLMGWVPKGALEELLTDINAFGGLDYVVDDAEDAGITPPTKLKNGPLGRIFEPFLRMYGLPNYREFDPSTFMAITYCLFFGIMFGDAGQGALLILFGLFMALKKKMWLGRIIACCGVSSVVFGFVYGSVFGFEDILPGFKILEGSNVLYLLLASLGLGAVLIGYVMVINIANGVRQRDFDKIFFGPNGVAGMVFYFGLILAAVLTLLGVANLFTAWFILPVIVLPLIVMLFREPLSKLAAGKKDWKPESVSGLLVGGFFELFETLLSFLTNTLSFLRVGAYAITHVALMLVVHALAGSGNIVVLVLGNLFVMGLESVMVCIQVLRLEFYELFGRFYQDSGREFQPKIVDYSAKLN
ncbi:MAG TPA: ATPase V [Candidatus Enterenecus stercoripullorum]|nr:ATPase V [Candidatus Enterenecus stercoripullorum]